MMDQIVFDIPVSQSGGNQNYLRIITGQDTFTTAGGTAVSFASGFAYAPRVVATVADGSAGVVRILNTTTGGFDGESNTGSPVTDWIAVGLHAVAL
jgi:hypothetical protein